MGLRVNTNVASLSAQRALGKTTRDLNSNLRKLSSGSRITRAADDAAGLAISEKLKSQIRRGRWHFTCTNSRRRTIGDIKYYHPIARAGSAISL